jgi:hypothetical protein
MSDDFPNLLSAEEIFPAHVHSDHLCFDSAHDLPTRLIALQEDMFHATFPSGVVLDVGWYPHNLDTGRFVAVLVDNPAGEWTPFLEESCRSISKLKAILLRFIAIARTYVSRQPLRCIENLLPPLPPGFSIYPHDFLLDVSSPAASQATRFHDTLFSIRLPGGTWIDVAWEPAGDPAGAFHIRFQQPAAPNAKELFDTVAHYQAVTIPALLHILRNATLPPPP